MTVRVGMLSTLLVMVLLGAVVAQAWARSEEALIDQAITAYEEGQSLSERVARSAAFQRAERLFNEAAVRGLANADIYANAGTAALQAERLGPAVLAFRRALVFDPDHPRARRNLDHARALLPTWVPRPETDSLLDTFFFWHRALSADERSGAAAVCFLLAALAWAGAIRWPSGFSRGAALLPTMAWLGLVASLAVEARSERGFEAVIVADEAVARASDSPNAPARFAEPLPGGTEVEVVETRERWVRIRLASDLEAWVSRTAVQSVNPSIPALD